MPTSGNSNFTQTRDQLCSDALQLIGRLGEGETATTNALSFCSNILNKLLKHWETQGIHLWTTSEGTIFLRNAVNKYTLSLTGDNACDDSTLVETVLSSDASGSSVSVSSSTGMTNGDIIGVALNDNTRQWTTIVSVAGTSVTLTDALTGAANSGNTVFSYTTSMGRPLKILDSRCRTDSNTDLGMDIQGRVEFMRITTKNSSGFPNCAFYSPNRADGSLYVWPVPNNVSQRLKVSYIRAIQDVDSGTDELDISQEAYHALTYNLARMLAPAYGIDLQRKELTDIISIANQSIEELKAWDIDSGSIYIVPDDSE